MVRQCTGSPEGEPQPSRCLSRTTSVPVVMSESAALGQSLKSWGFLRVCSGGDEPMLGERGPYGGASLSWAVKVREGLSVLRGNYAQEMEGRG